MRLVGLYFFPLEDATNYTCMTDKVRICGRERQRERERDSMLLGVEFVICSCWSHLCSYGAIVVAKCIAAKLSTFWVGCACDMHPMLPQWAVFFLGGGSKGTLWPQHCVPIVSLGISSFIVLFVFQWPCDYNHVSERQGLLLHTYCVCMHLKPAPSACTSTS